MSGVVCVVGGDRCAGKSTLVTTLISYMRQLNSFSVIHEDDRDFYPNAVTSGLPFSEKDRQQTYMNLILKAEKNMSHNYAVSNNQISFINGDWFARLLNPEVVEFLTNMKRNCTIIYIFVTCLDDDLHIRKIIDRNEIDRDKDILCATDPKTAFTEDIIRRRDRNNQALELFKKDGALNRSKLIKIDLNEKWTLSADRKTFDIGNQAVRVHLKEILNEIKDAHKEREIFHARPRTFSDPDNSLMMPMLIRRNSLPPNAGRSSRELFSPPYNQLMAEIETHGEKKPNKIDEIHIDNGPGLTAQDYEFIPSLDDSSSFATTYPALYDASANAFVSRSLLPIERRVPVLFGHLVQNTTQEGIGNLEIHDIDINSAVNNKKRNASENIDGHTSKKPRIIILTPFLQATEKQELETGTIPRLLSFAFNSNVLQSRGSSPRCATEQQITSVQPAETTPTPTSTPASPEISPNRECSGSLQL